MGLRGVEEKHAGLLQTCCRQHNEKGATSKLYKLEKDPATVWQLNLDAKMQNGQLVDGVLARTRTGILPQKIGSKKKGVLSSNLFLSTKRRPFLR